MIMNGSREKQRGWMYVGGTGISLIDYIIVNENARKEILKIKERKRENEIKSCTARGRNKRREKEDQNQIEELERSD